MAKTERSGHTTTDHDFIRGWVEERGGWPARVAGTEGNDDAGLIRIDFPGYSGEGSLEQIEWEEWFQKFDESELAFLHRDMSHGGGDLDRFNKLVRRGGDDDGEEEPSGGGSRGRSTGTSSRKSSGASRTAASKSANGKSGDRKTASSRGGSAAKSSGASKSGAASKSGSSRGGASKSGAASKSGGSSRGSASKSGSTSRSGAKSGSSAREQGAEPSEPSELRELLVHGLGDLLFAERQFLVSTRALAREAQNPEVKARVEEHVDETQGQIERLQQAFGAIGMRPKPVKCEAALGLKEEHDSFKSEEKPSKALLSAFDLGSGLRVEHYEIAAYRSTIAVATALGEKECAALLKESLQEELAMASFLEKNSLSVLREMARA